MLKAFVKLLIITIGTLIMVSFGVVFVRWMGLQQNFKAPPHPWFDRSAWNVLKPDISVLCATNNVDRLVPNASWLVMIPVIRLAPPQQKDEWVIPCPNAPKRLLVYLEAQDHKDWILNVHAKETWGLDLLVEEMQPLNKDHHFAVSTDSQKVAIYLRKKAPEWLFAADSSTMVRFQMFEGLRIETAMDFWPDFVIADFSQKFHLDERAVIELQRRQKRIVWDQTYDQGVAQPPAAMVIQGIMTRAVQ